MDDGAGVGELARAIRGDLRRLPRPTAPSVRAVRQQYAKALIYESPRTILAIANTLISDASWPARLCACELVARREDAMRLVTAGMVERWATGLADWGAVDMFGVTLAGLAWRKG